MDYVYESDSDTQVRRQKLKMYFVPNTDLHTTSIHILIQFLLCVELFCKFWEC